jgi:hypothetical protein
VICGLIGNEKLLIRNPTQEVLGGDSIFSIDIIIDEFVDEVCEMREELLLVFKS